MDKQYGEFVGVDKVYTFDVLEDTDGNYRASTPEYFCPAAEVTNEAEINNTPTYYDNKPGNNYTTEGVTTVNLTLSNVPADKMASHLGKVYDPTSGRVFDDGETNPPDKGLMFRYNMGKGDYRYYCYLKGTFSGGTEEGASKSNDVDVRNYQATYTAIPTTHEWTIDGKLRPLKRTYGDTANSAFDPSTWYTQAQTPDTIVGPNELTMTSVPADNATGVAVAENVVITFNNKIASYNAVMTKSDFTPVTTTNSFDATGNILTINPNADLSASSSYAVILTNVKDIYGQSLEDQVINFTTA